jgi:hypothetical protein
MKQYSAIDGQSIFDICLNCYGTLDLLLKLIVDSGIENVNHIPISRELYTYDDSLVIDQKVTLAQLKYATNIGGNGNVYYIIKQTEPPHKIKTGIPVPPKPFDMYLKTASTSYTSNVDGITVITLVDENGGSMIGNDIVQIEREIKPLFAADYVWNKNQGQLTLLNGVTLDSNQTLFVLYNKMIIS